MSHTAAAELTVLSAMITPSVLISAVGLLVLSTSNRLARIVDRARTLGGTLEQVSARTPMARGVEIGAQLATYARRGRLLQAALTSFYVSLTHFVGATIGIGLVSLVPVSGWLPSILGILGIVFLFCGCLILITETVLALRSISSEMQMMASRAPSLIASPSDVKPAQSAL